MAEGASSSTSGLPEDDLGRASKELPQDMERELKYFENLLLRLPN
jgi:hypothetical protein